ncbi:hypothetical protein [Microbacterium aurugineum]
MDREDLRSRRFGVERRGPRGIDLPQGDSAVVSVLSLPAFANTTAM